MVNLKCIKLMVYSHRSSTTAYGPFSDSRGGRLCLDVTEIHWEFQSSWPHWISTVDDIFHAPMIMGGKRWGKQSLGENNRENYLCLQEMMELCLTMELALQMTKPTAILRQIVVLNKNRLRQIWLNPGESSNWTWPLWASYWLLMR